jgi:hypothetical protein
MRLILTLLSCLLSFVASDSFASAQGQRTAPGSQKIESSSWIKVTPKVGGFTVLMPGTPEEKAADLEIASTKIPTISYSLKLGETNFVVQRWGDFPEPLIKAGYLDGLFANMHRVFFEMKGPDGKTSLLPFTRTDISLDGNTGHEYQAACGPYKKVSGPCSTTIRVYKAGGSIFVVGWSGPKLAQSDEQAQKFFSSFILIP